jgi:pyruvate ferredoxin oxidoreductase beta subunit
MMAIKLKDLSKKKDSLAGGHRACAGCGPAILLRQATLAVDDPLVVAFATGCMEVVTTIYPYTAWRIPYIHNAFENAGATMSGVETAYRSLKKQGKLPVDKEIKFIAFGGDGGTYDIGLQSLSGAMERGHNMVYICYDNEGYMNTGIQRSSATPLGAATTTAPAGKVVPGKQQNQKDLAAIIAAHHIPYVAQTSIHNWRDVVSKVQKAVSVNGPAFINVLAPCHRGWRYPMEKTVYIAELATETCFWPLYEVENGKYTINYKPKEKKPVEEWLKQQRRFEHLFKDENREIIGRLQAYVDERWNELLKRAEA